MSEWKEYRFSEIIELIGGGTPKTSNSEYWNGNIPWLSVADFNTGRKYVSSTEKMISEKGLKESSTRLLNSGDIIISARGTVGVVAMLDKPMTFNQSCYGIRGIESISNINYVYYLLKNTISGFQQIAHGGVFDTITRDTFKEIEISLPTLPEQTAIASILSSFDDKIDLLHRQNATLEKMAETLFRQWFVEEAKEEWKTVQLKEVTDIAIGRTPPRKEYQWFSTNSMDIKWISIKDLGNDGIFINNTSEYLTYHAVKEFNIPIIPKDTVVLSFKMTVGRVAITSEEMLSNEAIAHFKFNLKTPFTKEFLFLFLKTYKYDTLGSTSSIVTAINSSMIKEFEISIPDSQTMESFRNQTEPLFNKIKSNQSQIRTLTTLRDTLLPKLISGEVRVEY